MSEELYALLKRRDGEIQALRAYATELEEMVRLKREDEASDEARRRANKEIDAVRYQHGFKVGSDLPWRGDD